MYHQNTLVALTVGSTCTCGKLARNTSPRAGSPSHSAQVVWSSNGDDATVTSVFTNRGPTHVRTFIFPLQRAKRTEGAFSARTDLGGFLSGGFLSGGRAYDLEPLRSAQRSTCPRLKTSYLLSISKTLFCLSVRLTSHCTFCLSYTTTKMKA